MKKKPKNNKNNKITKNIIGNFILWTLIITISLLLLNYTDTNKKSKELPYSQFLNIINTENENKLRIKDLIITGNELVATCDPECLFDSLNVNSFNVILPSHDADKIEEWDKLFKSSRESN